MSGTDTLEGAPLTTEQARAALDARIDARLQLKLKEGTIDADTAESESKRLKSDVDVRLAALEAQNQERSMDLPGSGDAERGSDKSWNWARAAKALVAREAGETNWERHAGVEVEMDTQLRTHGEFDDEAAGFLVPTEVADQFFVEALRPKLIALELGIQTFEAGGGVVQIPVESDHPDFEDVAENEGGTDSGMKIGQIEASPRSCQAQINISRDLLRDSPGAEALIQNMIARESGIKLNRWMLHGQGGANEPVGIFNQAGIQSVDFSDITVTKDTVPDSMLPRLMELMGIVEEADAMNDAGQFGFALATKALRAFKQIRSTQSGSGPELQMARSIVEAGKIRQVLDYDYRTSNILSSGADTEVMFGDFSQAMLLRWGGMRVEASNVAGDAFERNQTKIVARQRAGFLCLQPMAFAVAADLDISAL